MVCPNGESNTLYKMEEVRHADKHNQQPRCMAKHFGVAEEAGIWNITSCALQDVHIYDAISLAKGIRSERRI